MSGAVPYAEVIGDPIAQSKSPLIHSFWLEALGIAPKAVEAVVPAYLARYRRGGAREMVFGR